MLDIMFAKYTMILDIFFKKASQNIRKKSRSNLFFSIAHLFFPPLPYTFYNYNEINFATKLYRYFI